MNEIISIGVDLAKNVLQLHGVDRNGKPVLRRQLRRSEILEFFLKQPGCLVGIEACASAHYWARELIALGREVRLMQPSYAQRETGENRCGRSESNLRSGVAAIDAVRPGKVLGRRLISTK